MEKNNMLSQELEECQTKLVVATAELEDLKKSQKASNGKYNHCRKVQFCGNNDFKVCTV